MNAEQLTTILSNLLTGGGVIFFLGMWIRSLRKQLDIQKDTMEAVKAQVSETEKNQHHLQKAVRGTTDRG